MIRAWSAFILVAALVLAGTGLLTRHVVSAERARLANEVLGQALWRLDTDAAALLVAEAGRPPDQPGADGALSRIEVGLDGILRSASGRPPPPDLARVVVAFAPDLPLPGTTVAPDPGVNTPFLSLGSSADGMFGSRAGNTSRLQQAALDNRRSAPAQAGPVVARWSGSDLLLVRRVQRSDGSRIQAALLDREALEMRLLAGIADLLPVARLEPTAGDTSISDRMAVLPLRLVATLQHTELSRATWAVLGLAWMAVALGLGGTAAALLLTQRLAERRAAFVSAVTHELRTPLTALRLHADLLADPRVGDDPDRRNGAIAILGGEAQRLARLVDNVLDYARLERRRPAQPRVMRLSEALGPLLPGLHARLAEAGQELVTSFPADAAVRCDPDALGRILLNLVDNAAKYAAGASDRRVELTAEHGRNRIHLTLRDRGPGLADEVRARVFTPFTRSAEAAAGSAPGVGLGLGLCRRLARAQGGDLRLEAPDDGGLRVVLDLPKA